MGERIILVDSEDNIIGSKERELLTPQDIYRVSALWLENSSGQVLLAQRAFTKKKGPGQWGPAAAGTVAEGETYDTNIVKEAEEEIGLTGVEFKKSVKIKNQASLTYFVQYFTAAVDKDASEFIVQKEEVEQVKWFDKKNLLSEIEKHPENFTPSAKRWVDIFLELN